ncbi:hypothetical protein WB44_01495 [Synechococcus sp. WH 8020]|nr:hypothetical protein WB44_01495 [Synechococcus sp. WH 8020]
MSYCDSLIIDFNSLPFKSEDYQTTQCRVDQAQYKVIEIGIRSIQEALILTPTAPFLFIAAT